MLVTPGITTDQTRILPATPVISTPVGNTVALPFTVVSPTAPTAAPRVIGSILLVIKPMLFNVVVPITFVGETSALPVALSCPIAPVPALPVTPTKATPVAVGAPIAPVAAIPVSATLASPVATRLPTAVVPEVPPLTVTGKASPKVN